ncbi:oral-facial-digital syndrome 1 protein homolog isoform X1 [Polyodon spathula]|uniref:oral-facial-digital syndrome 1 protein homolog isoform X1 n=1 Tax=Polyodon spathula TaxID=7913 RepID=UPI001B7E477B|nr:oral-facial-digital syndrome 1 protein homolog isoform X1 [Polyodon spathula]XP_041127531.1 oral-facial-digital syndrome 1 protein homolog isoform X1 [Polyodon spathula]
MSSMKDETVSPDELRKRLYQTFKNRGVLDSLKTQLRNQLIHQLKHPVLSGEVPPQPIPVEADSVLVQASNSLVVDHLRRCGFEYSLSVFYPECGLETDKVFSTRDLLQLMNISPRSMLYKSLTSAMQNENKKGFLMKLLIELTDHLHKVRQDADTQTDLTPHYRESLAEKMQLIDDQFAVLYQKGSRWESLEAKLSEYRKEIEGQIQAEMDQKMQHFKEVELAKLRMEEKAKSHKELSELKRELERTYQTKSDALISREKNSVERLQKQKEIEEKEIYTQRQSLLKEIETLRNRDAELKQRTEAFEMNCKLQEEKNRSIEEALRRRELASRTIEETYDQKLKNELLRYQLELKEDYLKRTEKVTEDEKRNIADAARLREEFAVINSNKEEHRHALAELRKLQVDLDSASSQIYLLTQQNELLKERLNETTDYPLLKRERLELQTQLKLLKRQLEEAHEENRKLREEFRWPTSEYLALQAELRRVANTRKLDEEEFESRKRVLEEQLQKEVEHSAQIKTQLLECEERAQWLTTQAEDVKLQLRQTQQALENEVFRNPKPSLVDRSVLDLTADKVVPPDIYVDGPLLRGRPVSEDVLFEPVGSKSCRYSRAWTASQDSGTELVAGAKARIKELEKEAESLEEAYRNYQHRAIKTAISGSQPARPWSPPETLSIPRRSPSASHSRVTFADKMLPSQELHLMALRSTLYDTQNLNGAGMQGQETPSVQNCLPPRRLSSTPLSLSDRQESRRLLEDQEGSFLTPCHRIPERQISPIPSNGYSSTVVRAADTDSPGRSSLKSTSREHSSSQKKLGEVSSPDSSPHPEKLTFEDLAESIEDHSDIPEQLEDDVSHQSEDWMNRLSVTIPEPIAATSQQDHTIDQKMTEGGERQKREDKEKEERKWELERKNREEKRLQERQTAWEREQRELEQLEQERKLLENSQHHEDKKGETEVGKTKSKMSESEDNNSNPVEKYLKIVKQHKEPELEQSLKREAAEQSSIHDRLSDEKDDSIAGISHEDTNEDFW